MGAMGDCHLLRLVLLSEPSLADCCFLILLQKVRISYTHLPKSTYYGIETERRYIGTEHSILRGLSSLDRR